MLIAHVTSINSVQGHNTEIVTASADLFHITVLMLIEEVDLS